MWLFFWEKWRVTCFRSLDDIFRAQSWKIVETEEVLTFPTFFFLPSPLQLHHSPLLFTRISARLIHSLSLQTKINDMNTSSYSREPPSPKRATPQNASVGEKASHPSGNPQLARKTKLPPSTFHKIFSSSFSFCSF